MIPHQSILNKISQTPGLITSLDNEFEEAIDYRVIPQAQAPDPDLLEANIREVDSSALADRLCSLAVSNGSVRAADWLSSSAVAVDSVASRGVPAIFGSPPVFPQPQPREPEPLPTEPLFTAEPRTLGALPRPPRGPGDSTIDPEQELELRKAVTSGKVLNLLDRDEYLTSALTSNLLYTRKTPGLVVVTDRVEELQAVVNIARKHNIQLTVQGGGHSYASYSLNYCGILVDMSKFGKELINVDLTEKTVTIPAGCRWDEVYNVLSNKYPRGIVLGGKCKQVGVSGYVLGGGISPFSRGHGLLIDNIVKMKIITASGAHITIEPGDTDSSEGRLCWALQGGGGGNFGILTEFTTKIHDLVSADGTVSYGTITWKLPTQQSDFQRMLETLNSDAREWTNKLTMDIIWQEQWDKELQKMIPVGQLIVIFDGPEKDYGEEIKPLMQFNGTPKVKRVPWVDVAADEQGWSLETPAFHLHTSFVFGEHSLTSEVAEDITKLMDKTRELLKEHDPDGKAYLIWVHIGGKTAVPHAEKTAFYWREASYVSYFKLQWLKSGITNKMVEIIEMVNTALRPHTIDKKAAYVNFVDRTIPNWQEAYYGTNYKRLQEIKEEWDPRNVFRFEQSIKLPERTDPGATPGEGQAQIEWDRDSLPFPEYIWKVKVPKALSKEDQKDPVKNDAYLDARRIAATKIKGIILSQMGGGPLA